jgi:hypothetical protein
MALGFYSKFYYGFEVTNQNKWLEFHDGIALRTAEIATGYYNSVTLIVEIIKQMKVVSGITFVVSFDRVNRQLTISHTSNFTLKVATGFHNAESLYELIGFTGADRTGASVYTSNVVAAKEYSPQLYLQSYKPTSQNRKSIDGMVNKTTNGRVEVIKFGNERFMSCQMDLITDIPQGPESHIVNNQNGVKDFIEFMEYCVEKGYVEFMENSDDPNIFQTLLLESTQENKDGLDYDLKELYDRGLPEYFSSGALKFKLIEGL